MGRVPRRGTVAGIVVNRWAPCVLGLALVGAACGRSIRHEPRRSPGGEGGEPSSTGGSGGKGAMAGVGTGGSVGSGAEGGTPEAAADFTIDGEFDLEFASCAAIDAECMGRGGCELDRRVFVIHDGELLKLAYASQGDINLLTLLPSGDHYTIDRTLVLTYLHEASAPPYSLSAGPFDVRFRDTDDDGEADEIRLVAPGTCDNTTTDVEELRDVDVILGGLEKVTNPSLSVQGDGWLAPVDISSNEPLTLDSRVLLVAEDGTGWDATPITRASLYATGFTIAAELPPATDFLLQIDVQNTAGGRTVHELPFRTFDAWSPLEDLGFEQGVDPHLVGTSRYTCDHPTDSPRLAAYIGNVPAIEGESSLLVPYGQNVALLLERPSGATKLRLSVVPLYARDYLYEPFRVQLANRRGTATSAETSGSDDVTETGDAVYPLAGPLETLELELPKENGDLLLEIQAPCIPSSFDAFATAAWVDALEFE